MESKGKLWPYLNVLWADQVHYASGEHSYGTERTHWDYIRR